VEEGIAGRDIRKRAGSEMLTALIDF